MRIKNIEDLKKNDFFINVNFDDIFNKKVTPNIIPVEINQGNNYISDFSEEQKDKENYNISNFEMPDDDYFDEDEENKN